MSGITSASMTLSDDFERSWLRSSRTVSRFVSTSSVPPATKPATRTRWNGETSIFGLDRRLDRDLEVRGPAGDGDRGQHRSHAHEREAIGSSRCRNSCGH